MLGDEGGAFEVGTWPLKLVRDLRLNFSGASVAQRVVTRPQGATGATFELGIRADAPLRHPLGAESAIGNPGGSGAPKAPPVRTLRVTLPCGAGRSGFIMRNVRFPP